MLRVLSRMPIGSMLLFEKIERAVSKVGRFRYSNIRRPTRYPERLGRDSLTKGTHSNARPPLHLSTCNPLKPIQVLTPRLLRTTSPLFSIPMSRSSDVWIQKFTHLKTKPREKEALAYLQRVASLVKPLMRKHNWNLPVLAEFFPANASLLGEETPYIHPETAADASCLAISICTTPGLSKFGI